MPTASPHKAPEAPEAASNAAPKWNLADLYPDPGSQEFAADLARVRAEAKAFQAAYRGRLADMLASPAAGQDLHRAVALYEALQDLGGRLMSYASLLHAGDTAVTDSMASP